jgi:regulator of extracellular matrix RemA (YlzA/DUF370 family)
VGIRLVSVGLGSSVSASRVIAVVSPDSAPVKRLILEARESGRIIDATCGRKTRGVVVMDSGHVVLSSIQPETLALRFSGKEGIGSGAHESD